MKEDSERDEVKHIDQYGGGTEQAEKLKREEDGTWKMVEKTLVLLQYRRENISLTSTNPPADIYRRTYVVSNVRPFHSGLQTQI